MGSPPPDPELLPASQALIAESRRVRAELDSLWSIHLGWRERVNDHCLSFLSEANSRLEARETARTEGAHRAIDSLF
jgi:hypothetical protein